MNGKAWSQRSLSMVLAVLLLPACGSTPPTPPPIPRAPAAEATSGAAVDVSSATGLLRPADLVYHGAFRLPDGPEEIAWAYGGASMAYYPGGDPDGPSDGYPGSIFGTGHDWNQWVSEIGIPLPVVSPDRDVAALNTAATLQAFHDVRGNLFGEFEIPRVGLAYLPPQEGQTTGKLHFCWAQHMGEGETHPSHGWCELDLSDPRPAGPWRIDGYWNYVTAGYLFAIPQDWAGAHTPGMRLATGRFRDGGQGARGPSLLAIGPWNEGDPPPAGSTVPAIPLLLYSDVTVEGGPTLRGYHHSDEWSGGAWLTAGARAAVVFVGTKGVGEGWYGCSDGTLWEPPYPEDCPDHDRGWWSTEFAGQILFYDPADLAAVAHGQMASHEPQPYATLDLDQYLYHVESSQQKHHVGAASFDRERRLLFVFEPFADGDKPLIHVWKVEG
jgi:hypothetical protein